jgi:benzoylformate decarboxylase
MPTIREATFELLRAHRMTTIFGKTGSTELPMLGEFRVASGMCLE